MPAALLYEHFKLNSSAHCCGLQAEPRAKIAKGKKTEAGSLKRAEAKLDRGAVLLLGGCAGVINAIRDRLIEDR
jgi:hypothetical protein